MWRLSCRENLFSEIPKVCFKETQPAWPEITLENFVGYDSAKYKFDCARTSIFTIPTKLKLYNTCILPIFLYGFECWAVTKRDVLKIDALDQWCLRKLLGIKWYHHVWNDEVRQTTGQPRLSAIVQARHLSLFGHIARMPDETDARSIITASHSDNWRKPPGSPRTTWMKTIQQDLRSNNLSLDEAITVAQNRPRWRLMSAFGATHP